MGGWATFWITSLVDELVGIVFKLQVSQQKPRTSLKSEIQSLILTHHVLIDLGLNDNFTLPFLSEAFIWPWLGIWQVILSYYSNDQIGRL